MLRLISDAVQQYLDERSVDELKVILAEISDHANWQDFIQDTLARTEQAAFKAEFAADCRYMSTAALLEIKNDAAMEELEAREQRRSIRERVLASLLNGDGDDGDAMEYPYYKALIEGDWSPPECSVEYEHISEEEKKDIQRTHHAIYIWAINNKFFDAKTDYEKIAMCCNDVPRIVRYLAEHGEKECIAKIYGMVLSYYENMPITKDIGFAWYLDMARAVMGLVDFPLSHSEAIDIIRRHLVALQQCHDVDYAQNMLFTLRTQRQKYGDDHEIYDIVQQVTYDYIDSHPKLAECGRHFENMSFITLLSLVDLIQAKY